MSRGLPIVSRLRRPPYGPLLLWAVAAVFLGAAFVVVQLLSVGPATHRLAEAEAAWSAARQRVASRMEARQVQKNLNAILNALPEQRDFAQLPLTISVLARRDRVSMPNLSYTQGKSEAGGFSKAALKGSAAGRYEDLRRFIYDLEASEGFLFIEDLDVGRHSAKQGEAVTVQVTLSTYVRAGSGRHASFQAGSP